MANWKSTLNLPRTEFPMKASLQKAEPGAISRWDEIGLYERIRARRTGAPKCVLHDGPPYANGRIHIGTALNKILKDFVVRAKTMAGFDSPYVPGWDCHGLPIELMVERELGPKKHDMTTSELRRACRVYAETYVDVQREDFRRLGVLGAWSKPYLTMAFRYQAAIVRALGRFVEQDMVYRGKKPVHWCTHCQTALAEAEVEYELHTSPSIYVEFPMAQEAAAELAAKLPALAGRSVSALIWTTTPWTIPSNLAVAFHPDLDYGFYSTDANSTCNTVIVADAISDRIATDIGRHLTDRLAVVKGCELEGLSFQHPLYDRPSVGVLGNYVTLEQGTGIVHTAPGHGADDFTTGVKYGLETYAPVDSGGQFDDTVETFAGMRVFDANPKIEDALADSGRLWHRSQLEHSYPHCWRCRHPVIFLATSQWFIGMETVELRQRALDAIQEVQWFPTWGQERIHNMLAYRPDWCISRQRSWGVPIPAVYCTKCGEAVLTKALTDRAAKVFETHGADAWYERDLSEFVPPEQTCAKCGGADFERERDILDVWFDSGSSHEAVLDDRQLGWPAEIYLEGSDQYRGWFHSSLLVGLGTRGQAPYRQVITHGFVVDEAGRKMSKSLGNDIAPQAIIEESGAEILRLWVSMVDYREDVRIGKEILARVVEAYRKIRNTLRILVANLHDFHPESDTVPTNRLEEFDRFELARYADMAKRVVSAYNGYDFQTIFHTLNGFLTVDLSALYIDVAKDRLYTFAAAHPARRSAQTAIFRMADGLARLIAPILPVTADEVWKVLPGSRDISVHLADFPSGLDELIDAELVQRWERLIKIREAVNARIEVLRKKKTVGTSLEACVRLQARGDTLNLLERYRDELPTLFIAQTQVESGQAPPTADGPVAGEMLAIEVDRADGIKCERCWRYVPSVANQPNREGPICGRCVEMVGLANGHCT
ncbi:MAG: isoleucine--tRNA ligase [Acidobacteria bacterium]|nr:isoleucine--tRNA ligase [Acidobacteriota bacterium]|tara:strand:+ start:3119 stop:5944 length:2826 start_codon:yes stop_codon:yes gene_type:complete